MIVPVILKLRLQYWYPVPWFIIIITVFPIRIFIRIDSIQCKISFLIIQAERCDNNILNVITVLGKFGFLTLNPIKLLTSSFNDNFFCCTSCIILVAEKDLEIDAILKISFSESEICFSLFLYPNE